MIDYIKYSHVGSPLYNCDMYRLHVIWSSCTAIRVKGALLAGSQSLLGLLILLTFTEIQLLTA